MALSGGQLRGLVDGLAELYRPDGGDFPARVVRVMAGLAAADHCSYNHFGASGLLGVHVEPAGVGAFPGAASVFERHIGEHPVLVHHRATGTGHALRISDFLSDRQFRELGLYREFYWHTGTNYQLAFSVPAPADGLIGIALNREQRDFTDEDAELLELVRPHIAQAAAIADLLSQPLPGLLAGPGGAPPLTARQASIVRLVAAGHADRHIARSLGISPRTVHAHLRNIYRTLGVTSRTEAIARLRAMPAAATPAAAAPAAAAPAGGS